MIDDISSLSGLGSSSSQESKKNSGVDKQEFLKLLTYQLKSQNPMDPYDNKEFASQLAQFSQLEQMTEIKSLLEEQINTNMMLTQTISNTALPGLIGKTAKAISDKVYYDGEDKATIGFNNPYPAVSGEMVIKDSAGNTVRTIQLDRSQLSQGDHEYQWDGKANDGSALPEGEYSVEVNMKKDGGAAYSADTYAVGTIDAVRFKSEGTLLVISGMEVPLQNVMDIST